MSVLTTVVEGWTGALPFELQTDGSAFDYTGLTVQIVLRDCHNRIVLDSTAGITTTGSTGGEVIFSPSSSGVFYVDQSPYKMRYRVTDALGDVVFFPNGTDALIKVIL